MGILDQPLSNGKVPFEQSETRKNLLRAFAGESQARNRYTFAAGQAKKEGFDLLEQVFRFTADQEKEHGEIFYHHLIEEGATKENIAIDAAYPVDDNTSTLTLLRSAHHNEYQEFEQEYPTFAQKAQEEGYPAIAAHFQMIARIEQSHGDRFAMYADMLEQGKLFLNEGKTVWVCLNCGHIHTAAEAPEVCPVCDHAKGYFIRKTYEPFSC